MPPLTACTFMPVRPEGHRIKVPPLERLAGARIPAVCRSVRDDLLTPLPPFWQGRPDFTSISCHV